MSLPDLSLPLVSDSAVTQARSRLGAEPLKWVFEKCAAAWAEQHRAYGTYRGLQLLAMDGTTLRLADSPANRLHFGAQGYAEGAVSSYPQLRAVTLCALETQLVLAARFGPYATAEMTFAKEMLPEIPQHSLTIIDAGYYSAAVLVGLQQMGGERHFLIPAKTNSRWRLLEGDEDDGLVEMTVSSQARAANPALPATWQARVFRYVLPNGRTKVFLTSLLDRRAVPARELNECYALRWRIETSYRELKQTMLGMEMSLRSHSVEGTEQEVWGALIAYNLIRQEMALAAREARCEATDISFVLAFQTIQNELLWATPNMAQGRIPEMLQRIRGRLVQLLKVQRPGRTFDRVVKAKPQRYPQRRIRKTT
ncbi:IS4-like element ISCro3 family transposase [Massilia kyonggiensis]